MTAPDNIEAVKKLIKAICHGINNLYEREWTELKSKEMILIEHITWAKEKAKEAEEKYQN